MTNAFDAIVIGAGYIGCSIAYHLSIAGLRTALIDQGSIAAGASAANFGNIQIQDMELEKSSELTKLGMASFSTLEEELGWDLGYRKIGGLLPIENENQWKILYQRKERLNQIGIASEIISAEQLKEVEPYLDNRNMLGALYHANEGQIDPFQLIWAYFFRAKQNGLRSYFHNRVTKFNVHQGQLQGVTTDQGILNAKNVIVCTGAYTEKLGKTIGKNWNTHYVLGQSIVTEQTKFILNNHLASASFFEEGQAVAKGTIIANMAISQSTHGNILIGEAMFESNHFPLKVPARSISSITQSWVKYFPNLAKLRILRSWSAPVADVKDGLPLFGPVMDLPGLYLATAFRSTVIITPIVGKTISQLITSGQSDLNIESFLPERQINETNYE